MSRSLGLSYQEHTGSARVLAAHVAVLVSLDKALGLGGRGRATRELLVESNNPLHARGISGTANGLEVFRQLPISLLYLFYVPSFAFDRSIVVLGAQFVVQAVDRRRTGGGSGARTLGEATWIGYQYNPHDILCAPHTFGGTREETMIAVLGYVWGGWSSRRRKAKVKLDRKFEVATSTGRNAPDADLKPMESMARRLEHSDHRESCDLTYRTPHTP